MRRRPGPWPRPGASRPRPAGPRPLPSSVRPMRCSPRSWPCRPPAGPCPPRCWPCRPRLELRDLGVALIQLLAGGSERGRGRRQRADVDALLVARLGLRLRLCVLRGRLLLRLGRGRCRRGLLLLRLDVRLRVLSVRALVQGPDPESDRDHGDADGGPQPRVVPRGLAVGCVVGLGGLRAGALRRGRGIAGRHGPAHSPCARSASIVRAGVSGGVHAALRIHGRQPPSFTGVAGSGAASRCASASRSSPLAGRGCSGSMPESPPRAYRSR